MYRMPVATGRQKEHGEPLKSGEPDVTSEPGDSRPGVFMVCLWFKGLGFGV